MADKKENPFPRSSFEDCTLTPFGRYRACLILGCITLIAFFVIIGVGCTDGTSYGKDDNNCCWIATLVTGLVGSILTSVGGTGMRESTNKNMYSEYPCHYQEEQPLDPTVKLPYRVVFNPVNDNNPQFPICSTCGNCRAG